MQKAIKIEGNSTNGYGATNVNHVHSNEDRSGAFAFGNYLSKFNADDISNINGEESPIS